MAVDLEDNASAGLARLSSNVNGFARTSDVGGSAVDTMSKKMQAAEKGTAALSKSMTAGKISLSDYKAEMDQASKVLSDKQETLKSAKSAYESTTKEMKNSTTQLTSQKRSIESLIRTKENEISALEHENSIINKGSRAYEDNKKAIEWTKDELSTLEIRHNDVTKAIAENEAAVIQSSKAYDTAKKEVQEAEEIYKSYSNGLADAEKREKAAQRALSAERWQKAGKSIKDVGEGIDTVTKPIQAAAVGAVAAGVIGKRSQRCARTSYFSVSCRLILYNVSSISYPPPKMIVKRPSPYTLMHSIIWRTMLSSYCVSLALRLAMILWISSSRACREPSLWMLS